MGKKPEVKSVMEGLLQKLKKLVVVAQNGLQSDNETVGSCSANLLTLLFSNHKKLANYLPLSMRMSVWDAYRNSCLAQRWDDRLLENLVSTAREKELLPMVNAILQDLQNVSIKIG